MSTIMFEDQENHTPNVQPCTPPSTMLCKRNIEKDSNKNPLKKLKTDCISSMIPSKQTSVTKVSNIDENNGTETIVYTITVTRQITSSEAPKNEIVGPNLKYLQSASKLIKVELQEPTLGVPQQTAVKREVEEAVTRKSTVPQPRIRVKTVKNLESNREAKVEKKFSYVFQ